MAATVRISGLREVDRAFRQMEKDASKELRLALVEVAKPIAEDAQRRLSRYRGASVQTIRPRAVAKGAFVTQSAKKVSGLRADFGVLQMVKVMEPALAENYEQIMKGAEGVVDMLALRNGF
jgi:hypothetical protein